MIWKALREYEAVPVEPTAAERSWHTEPHGTSSTDVRQLPWVRPLAGDYAFNFNKVASLYAGDPTSADAWRAAIARAQQHASHREDVSRILEAQQTRRGAP